MKELFNEDPQKTSKKHTFSCFGLKLTSPKWRKILRLSGRVGRGPHSLPSKQSLQVGMIWHKFLVFNEWMVLVSQQNKSSIYQKKVFVYIRYYGTYYVNVGRFLLVTGGTKTGSFATLTLHIQTISKVQGKIIKLTLSKAQGFFNSHEKKWKKYLKKWRDRF